MVMVVVVLVVVEVVVTSTVTSANISEPGGLLKSTKPSLQVHHDGQNHWVLSSSIGSGVVIIDSYRTNKGVKEEVKKQLRLVYGNLSTGGNLSVELLDVQVIWNLIHHRILVILDT